MTPRDFASSRQYQRSDRPQESRGASMAPDSGTSIPVISRMVDIQPHGTGGAWCSASLRHCSWTSTTFFRAC